MIEIKDKLISIFNKLKFDSKSHTYTVDNIIYPSVSGLIQDFYIPFDRHGKSLSVAARRGITQEEVLLEWDTKRDNACEFGTNVHDFGENYVIDGFVHQVEDKDLTGHHKALLKFWMELPDFIVPLMLELRMYHPVYGYAGTSDIILLDTRDNSLVIADYKTNEDLFKNFRGETMVNGFGHLLNNNYNKYQLQLSFYQILLEQTGYRVSERLIIWLKPDGEYESLTATDYTKELVIYLNERLCQQ